MHATSASEHVRPVDLPRLKQNVTIDIRGDRQVSLTDALTDAGPVDTLTM